MSIILSWGRNGGVYAHFSKASWRLCLWCVALTVLFMEIDDLMAYAARFGPPVEFSPLVLSEKDNEYLRMRGEMAKGDAAAADAFFTEPPQ